MLPFRSCRHGLPDRLLAGSINGSGGLLQSKPALRNDHQLSERPGNPFVQTAFGFTDPLRGGRQRRRLFLRPFTVAVYRIDVRATTPDANKEQTAENNP